MLYLCDSHHELVFTSIFVFAAIAELLDNAVDEVIFHMLNYESKSFEVYKLCYLLICVISLAYFFFVFVLLPFPFT
jgi:hypothetical protein